MGYYSLLAFWLGGAGISYDIIIPPVTPTITLLNYQRGYGTGYNVGYAWGMR